MKKIILVACGENGCLGKDNDLPWCGKYSANHKHFETLTEYSCVLMGRRTFDSIGKPLPNRMNIIITRQNTKRLAEEMLAKKWIPVKNNRVDTRNAFHIAPDIKTGFNYAEKARKRNCYIVGGAETYKETLPMVNEIMLTKIPCEYEGDTYFPFWPISWKVIKEEKGPEGLIFITYRKPT